MPTLTDRIINSGPHNIGPLDHQHLARRARARMRRRRTGGVCLASLTALALSVGVVRTVGDDDDRTSLAAAPIAPDGTVLGEGFGTWTQGAESPIGPRYSSFDGVLSDGRVLVWGGQREGDDPLYSGAGEQLGGIYDPNSDTWTKIPAPPEPLFDPRVQLSDDRMLVVGSTSSGALGGAVFDTDSHSWSELPSQTQISIFADSVSWDGETAVLVRLDEGGRGYGENQSLDWTVSEPVTLRWNIGDEQWTQASPAPLSLRFGAGTLASDGLIYIIGGTERNPHLDNEPGSEEPGVADPFARADGAVYDVEADRWSPLPDLPRSGIHAHVGALPDGTILVGGALSTLQGPGEGLGPSWTLDGSTWTAFVAHPEPGSSAVVRDGIVQTTSLTGQSGPQAEWINVDGVWELAPLADLHGWGRLLLATSGTADNPDDGSFSVRLRAAQDAWLTSASAPFTNRMDASIRISGNRLVVIGGFEGPELTETTTVWVLELVG